MLRLRQSSLYLSQSGCVISISKPPNLWGQASPRVSATNVSSQGSGSSVGCNGICCYTVFEFPRDGGENIRSLSVMSERVRKLMCWRKAGG